MEKSFRGDGDTAKGSDYLLERPRLHRLLRDALAYPVVVICAGSGYGKTRALYSFLRNFEARASWMQISERDNVVTRFWESYTNTLSLIWPEAGDHLMEIGFPETTEIYAEYEKTMRKVSDLPGKHIRLFDDFHLLRNPEVLRFFEWSIEAIPPNVTIVLISRTTPELNMVGMMMQERVFTIQEDTLCFTEDEIAQFFSQLNIPVTRRDIRNIFEDTQGWAFAVNMIARTLIKDQTYERYALEAMKKNIFRLIKAELGQTISDSLWRFLLRISLIDHLSANLIRALAGDEALIEEMASLNAYVRYDFRMDAYMIHHLFLDYLRQNQNLLTPEEKRETYQAAGKWCDINGYHMDAYNYYEKSGDYDAIARKVGSYNLQMPPEMAKLAEDLFDNAPESEKLNNPIFPGLHIRLKMSVGQFNEDSLALARKYADDYESRPESPENFRALAIIYFNWALLVMCMSTYTDVYKFEHYFRKMNENYCKNPFKTVGTFNLVPMSTWASLVGSSRAGAHEEYINEIIRSIPSASVLGKGFLVGFDDLAWGELLFYRGNFDEAEQFLRRSVEKASESAQYVTLNRALVYLMQLSFQRGEYAAATEKLQALEEMLSEEDYGIRYTMYDIACGFYYCELGQPDRIPKWLQGDFSTYMHPAFLENYSNRIKVRYRYQTHQYSSLLGYFENGLKQNLLLFGRLGILIYRAMVLYQLKRRDEAIASLTEAYHAAEPNKIIVLFTQCGKDMRTLTTSILKDDVCPIPRDWLEEINRKSSAYAKRRSKMISEYREANQIVEEVSLSNREKQILKELSQGLSRSEIASSQNLSVNTVKMFVKSIYDKLNANSLADAIRIAAEKKLI